MKRMKRGLVAAGFAALLLLTGCTGMQEQETIAVASDAPAGTTAATPPAPVETESPAAPVEVTAAPEKTATQRDANDFLVRTQLALDNWGVTMNADQVRSAADYTCDQLAAGVPHNDVVAITGEVPDYANGRFVDVVVEGYCPVR
ncbi:hypothetical protein HR12_20835 [Microbacterium sp. SUBG005]|nr:hypothetical protein HR12_20835 [Microbacterium sp. SUBG005]